MTRETFDKLTKDVTVTRDHKNLFLYDDDVCLIVCHRFPARDQDYAIQSIEKDSGDTPYTDKPLLEIDETKLSILIPHPIE